MHTTISELAARTHLASDFNAAIAFVDYANIDYKPLAANHRRGSSFDELQAHHLENAIETPLK